VNAMQRNYVRVFITWLVVLTALFLFQRHFS
jgi:hypothetical protein